MTIHGFGPVTQGSKTPPAAKKTGIYTLADYQKSTIQVADQMPAECKKSDGESVAELKKEVEVIKERLESFVQETKEMIEEANKETDRLAKEAEALTIRAKLSHCAKGAYSYLAAMGGWVKKSQ